MRVVACLIVTLAAPAPAAPTAERPRSLKTLRGHTGFVCCVAFAPGGKTLATGGEDKTIRLWDVVTGKNTATLRGHGEALNSVTFSPDGKLLASASEDGTGRLWSVPPARSRP